MSGKAIAGSTEPSLLLSLAWIGIALQLALFLLPLGCALWLSLQASIDMGSPVSLTAWISLAKSSEARAAIFNSLALAAIGAIAVMLLALPLAFTIVRSRRWVSRLLVALLILMWLFDPGIRILGWMQVFKDLAVMEILPVVLVSGFTGELVATIHAWLPLTVLVIAIGFSRVEPAMLDAARECGATAFTLLFRLLLPMSDHFVLGAAAIAFCGAVGSFLEPRLLGTGEFQQISEWLQRALESETGWPYAAAMLLVMLLVSALPLVTIGIWSRREGGRA